MDGTLFRFMSGMLERDYKLASAYALEHEV